MATFDQIETALLAPFVPVTYGGSGQWDAITTPVAWENVELDPAALNAWMQVFIDPGQQRALTIDDAYTGTPVMSVNSFTKIGVGKQQGRLLLGTAVTMYQGVEIVTADATARLRLYSVSRVVQLPYDGWFKLAVQMSFRLF